MRLILFFLFLFVAGCVSLPDERVVPSASESKAQQLKDRISQLESENLSLRQRLEVAQKAEIRMPIGTEIQAALKNAGFYQGKIDGQIGSQTKEAIRKFQEANGLNPDGVIGSRTWEILIKYLESKSK